MTENQKQEWDRNKVVIERNLRWIKIILSITVIVLIAKITLRAVEWLSK